ncbi:sensor histidine kinase [Bacteroidota bacterium]
MTNLKNKIYKQLGLLGGIIIAIIILAFLLSPNAIIDFVIPNTLIAYLIFNSNKILFSKFSNFDKITGISFFKLAGTILLSFIVGGFLYCLVLLFLILITPEIHINEFIAILRHNYLNTIGFLLMITLVFLVLELFKGWKREAVNTEKRRYEELKFQYEILKNQINPHFLFNSLNILNSIISKDQEQAKQFVQNFSKIYRYVLEKRDHDFVTLSEELSFIESYFYLIKSRHLEKIDISININDDKKHSIIPMSLQLLVENAIKHNAATSENPLEIKVFLENDDIVVSNNINQKNLFEQTSKIGLENLSKRYQYLTKKDIKVVSNNEKFIVRLPVIKGNNK